MINFVRSWTRTRSLRYWLWKTWPSRWRASTTIGSRTKCFLSFFRISHCQQRICWLVLCRHSSTSPMKTRIRKGQHTIWCLCSCSTQTLSKHFTSWWRQEKYRLLVSSNWLINKSMKKIRNSSACTSVCPSTSDLSPQSLIISTQHSVSSSIRRTNCLKIGRGGT